MKKQLSLYYFLFFFATAIWSPFRNIYFATEGYSGAEIGLIGAVGSVMGILTAPLLGFVSDRARDYRTLLQWSVVLVATTINGFLFSDYFAAILVTQIVIAMLGAPLIPVVDSVAIDQSTKQGYRYGDVRVWGAVGWTVMMFMSGYIVTHWLNSNYKLTFPIYTVLVIGLFFVVRSLPPIARTSEVKHHVRAETRVLLRRKSFLAFTFVSMLSNVLVAVNEAFLPVYFQRMNFPMEFVTWNFAAAALIEIPLFIVVAKLIRRYSLMYFMIAGMFTYTLKYALMHVFNDRFPALITLQLLDGIALVLVLSASLEIVNLLAGDNVKATAQTFYGAIIGIGGLAGIIGNLAGGYLIDHAFDRIFFYLSLGAFATTVLFLLFPGRNHYKIPTHSAILDNDDLPHSS